MREQLVGYLIGALESDEQAAVEAELAQDAALKREMYVLERAVALLHDTQLSYPPPRGLAARTSAHVAEHAPTRVTPALSPRESAVPAGGWSLLDFAVAASVLIAAALLVLPAINNSRFHARVLACQNNLREVFLAFDRFSESADGAGRFPQVASSGNLSFVGSYAPMLVDGDYIDSYQKLVCPNSPALDTQAPFTAPTLVELESASDEAQLVPLRNQLQEAYGYTLGYTSGGRYHTRRFDRDPTYAVIADRPSRAGHERSGNHAGCGQNVLFADGHVRYFNTCGMDEGDAHFFRNADGRLAPGKNAGDAVIVPAHLPLSQFLD